MTTEHEVRALLLERYKVWMDAIARKDLSVIEDIYADDAVYMAPLRPRHAGKASVLEAWKMYFERPDFQALYTPTLTIASSLDMAYDVGTYLVSLTKDGKKLEIRGKYVVIWRKEGDRWVAAVDIDNTDAPV